MKGHYRRALVAAAATNPLVWAAALFALALAVCALVVLIYVVVWLYIRDELWPARTTTIAAAPPAEDDWLLNEPTPGLTTQLDEHGRVELLTHDLEPLPVAPPPAAPEPPPGPKTRAQKCRRTKKGDVPTMPERRDDLTHADLVRLAHKAGRKNANGRWSRARLLAVASAPCSRKEAP